MMRTLVAVLFWLLASAAQASAAPCLIVTLTGTGPGPAAFNGLAGAGTFVRYGDQSNGCGDGRAADPPRLSTKNRTENAVATNSGVAG